MTAMTCAPGTRLCPMCLEIVPLDPPCPTCVGREAGAQARDEWAPAADHHLIGEDEMAEAAAVVAAGAGL